MNPLLRVTDVSVAFGGLRALDSVTLEVPRGKVVGLIGPNGAGKTTLFNVISGLQASNEGRIALDDRDITKLAPHSRARLGVGRTFQHLGLALDETVGANIRAAQHLAANYHHWDVIARPWRWGREERRLRLDAEAAAVDAEIDDLWSLPVADLSFGSARFAEIAAVLVRRPRLLLMDEPTTGLDILEVERLLRILRSERDRGTTVLVVAHDVRFVMDLCDHVFVLAEGRLLFDGAPREVREHPAVVDAYLGRAAT